MSKKQILREWIALDVKPPLLKESREKNGGKLIISGVIQRAGVKNQNKRVYPRDVLVREMENYQKAIRENRAIGELDHPESSTVSLSKVSHILREAWWEGDDCYGRVEVLERNSHGKELAALLESGVTIGISSRGVGSTAKMADGTDLVQDDYQLICYDIVSEPSTPGAYLFAEGKQIDTAPSFNKADRIWRVLNDITRK
jgi:hypothetical protein